MKFTLIFVVGLFAFTSATDLDLFKGIPEVSLIEAQNLDFPPYGFNIPEKVNEVIQKALNEFNSLIQKFKDQSAINREKINEIAKKIQKRAEIIINEANEKIKELVKKGNRVGKCAIKYHEDLVKISTGVIDGLKECSTDIVLALKELTGVVLAYSDEFVKSVIDLKTLTMECYNEESKTAMAKCVLKNITEFTKLFGKIMTNTKAIILGAYEKGQDLVNATKACNDNHIQTTIVKVKDIKMKIDECVKLE